MRDCQVSTVTVMEGNLDGVLLVNLLDFVTDEYFCMVERGLGLEI